ncbi:MAG: hypothetical protein RIB60_11405 [Phycisphaerales bacterium]
MRLQRAWRHVVAVAAALLSQHAVADVDWHGSLDWRAIGPARGGRVQSVAGVIGDRNTYYMGATGGGVWKTTDTGNSWRNVTDGFLNVGSVGAVAVAPADPNVVYVGTGEADIRGNFSHGDGVYRSLDAGKTWEHVGLDDTRQIGRIAVHPRDEGTLFVAALGHVYGPNDQRGVFRSTDGGDTWERVLHVDDRTGAIDVAIDPINPRVIFACFWHVSRTPWSLDSGGPGSGLYRSTDGGDTWTKLTNGLPDGVKGKIGVSPSAAQRDLVYAIVEAEDGGVFRSTDGGDSWRRVNDDRDLRQRAWYYTHIYADPQDADTVYVMNVRFHKSIDGGRSWSTIRVPHVDNHDLWIDPHDNQRMINANDGGANVSFNGGQTWSTQTNQPTAQFYRVTTDNAHPYRVYGAQQDNSTASVSSRGRQFGGWESDLYSVGGCECGYIAVHPEDNDIVYAGCYGGYLSIYDHELGESRNISIWPENPMGAGVDVQKHRFQWTFPIVLSPHDPETVYVGGERVFRSTNRGQSWEPISDDLTTNDKSKQRSSGGPITQDNTSVEYYCTVFTIAESPVTPGVIWAGTDDGLIHVTSDDAETWENVTPIGMGDWPMISLIEASPHDADTAYAAVNRYKMNDFRPQVWRTTDRGKTWKMVVDGLPSDAFVRSVREDPTTPGLLYIGTETGVFYSYNAGDTWAPLQLNLPRVPITDVTVKDDDLVVATQGRSFWILDDLAVIRQLAPDAERGTPDDDEPWLFDPAPAYREGWDRTRFHVYIPEDLDELKGDGDATFTIRDADGDEVRSWTINGKGDNVLRWSAGMNQFNWNFRHDNPEYVPGAVAWPRHPPGPRAVPGEYTAELVVGEWSQEVALSILPDPRRGTTPEEYDAQFGLLTEINDALTAAHEAVNNIRAVRTQIDTALARAKSAGLDDDLKEPAKELREKLKGIEETIIQTKSKSAQDPLNYPIRLNDKIGALAYAVDGDFPPTAQSRAVFEHLKAQLDVQLAAFEEVVTEGIPAFNELVYEQRVPAIVLEDGEADDAGEVEADEDE